jgi:acyl-CoA thioesterase
VTVAAAADIDFVAPAYEGDVLVATATERTRFGRSGIYDVSVLRGDQVIAEFRGRSRSINSTKTKESP